MINRFLSTAWAKKKPVGRSGFFNLIFFTFFIGYDVLIILRKKTHSKFMKNIIQSGLFSPLGRWTGNNYLFKGGLGALNGGVSVSPVDFKEGPC